MNHNVVIISGHQGSGKTTLQKALCERLAPPAFKTWKAYPMIFAGPLYEMHDRVRDVLTDSGVPHRQGCEVKDGDLLQWLGTEFGRNKHGENIWVDLCRGRINKKIAELEMGKDVARAFFVIGDCRFLNELAAFPNALKIRLECPRDVRKARVDMWRENETHLSETALNTAVAEGKFDIVFDTSNTTVVHMVETIIHHLLMEVSIPLSVAASMHIGG